MKRKLLIATVLTAVVSSNVMAAHTDTHVKALANAEVTKRAPYARVNANGTVSLANGITNANASNPEPGLYCFNLAGIKGGQVTVDYNTSTGFDHGMFSFGAAFGFCKPGTTFFVAIMDASTSSFNNAGFYLRLYK